MEWQRGYVSDVPYTSGYYREASPGHQALTALMAGVRAPDPGGAYRCLELGCGTGVGLCILAAANPQAAFVGVDFLPAHVAAARRLIEAAGLTNVEVMEASFETLAAGSGHDLGGFDFAALHGVYTWVAPVVQQAVVALLDRCLRPGGLVYVGYNNMAGWAPVLPLQAMLAEAAGAASGDSLARMRAAIEAVGRMAEAGAPGLDLAMIKQQLKGDLDNADRVDPSLLTYLAHEYLNGHWRPLFITEVARDFAPAKLQFAGRADLLQAIPELRLTPQQRDAAAECGDPIAMELAADVMSPVAFRRDVFVRGALRISPERRESLLREVQLALVVRQQDAPMTLPAVGGELTLDRVVYAPVLSRLELGPARLGELVAIAASAQRRVSAFELAAVLVGGGAASPAVHSEAPPPAAARFNTALIETMRDHAALRFALASPLTGGGVDMPLAHCLAYLVASGREAALGGLDREPLRAIADGHAPLWRGLRLL